jgi:hypothetical protein
MDETVLLAFLSDFTDDFRESNRLKLPQHHPRLPIIRPPEGCENTKPTKFKNLHYHALPTPTSIRVLKIYPRGQSYSDFDL